METESTQPPERKRKYYVERTPSEMMRTGSWGEFTRDQRKEQARDALQILLSWPNKEM